MNKIQFLSKIRLSKFISKIILYISAISIVFFVLTSYIESNYFDVIRNFETYSSMYKHLMQNYLLDLDDNVLFEASVDGMLSTLDPYTVYFPTENKKAVTMMQDGKYTGFGITVVYIDSCITISSIVKGGPAEIGELLPGDKLYKIDGNYVLKMDIDSLGVYTNQKIGSIAEVKIIRGKDTLEKFIVRDEIFTPNISYASIIEKNYAYIKLDNFSKTCSNDFLVELRKLSQSNDLKGLIIDLRGNPGGLMVEAVNISSNFVPKNSPIVSTIGKDKTANFTFKTQYLPDYPDLPLVIIINGSSASASEILAGALQDLDRAVVIGSQSFGKGLVQSFFELPYGDNIKITTAKYYLPSGRCIQKKQIAKKHINSYEEIEKTFKTIKGRKVAENHGVTPDSLIDDMMYSDIIIELLKSQNIFNYTVEYARSHNIDSNFIFPNDDYRLFLDFLVKEKFKYKNLQYRLISKLKDNIDDKNINSDINDRIIELNSLIKIDNNNLFIEYKKEIISKLELDIIKHTYPGQLKYKYFINRDTVIKSAVGIFKTGVYKKILSN